LAIGLTSASAAAR